jgi:Ca2+-binding RTX toxin-like protein
VHAIGSLENLTLTGAGAINATGNELNNVLIGNSAANGLMGAGGNDTLNGGGGADKMYGGTGNDRYVIDNAGDVANETDGDGTDTILSSISFNLADTVHAVGSLENLTLTGTGAINAVGNALDNVLTGNNGANVLIGGIGADRLDGGGGVDTASYASSGSGVAVSLALGTGFGGDAEGDHLSNIENLTGSIYADTLEGTAGNNVLAGGAGLDTVSYANATAGANNQGVTVNLALTTAQNTIRAGIDTLSGFENLTGSQFNDTLTGSSGNNVLTGLSGNDKLTGLGGNDTFVFFPGFGNDTVTDFTAGPNSGPHDLMAFDHTIFADFDAVLAASTQVGTSTIITIDAQNTVTLVNMSVGSLHHDDFAFV